MQEQQSDIRRSPWPKLQSTQYLYKIHAGQLFQELRPQSNYVTDTPTLTTTSDADPKKVLRIHFTYQPHLLSRSSMIPV